MPVSRLRTHVVVAGAREKTNAKPTEPLHTASFPCDFTRSVDRMEIWWWRRSKEEEVGDLGRQMEKDEDDDDKGSRGRWARLRSPWFSCQSVKWQTTGNRGGKRNHRIHSDPWLNEPTCEWMDLDKTVVCFRFSERLSYEFLVISEDKCHKEHVIWGTFSVGILTMLYHKFWEEKEGSPGSNWISPEIPSRNTRALNGRSPLTQESPKMCAQE